jgi:hypothetical protein
LSSATSQDIQARCTARRADRVADRARARADRAAAKAAEKLQRQLARVRQQRAGGKFRREELRVHLSNGLHPWTGDAVGLSFDASPLRAVIEADETWSPQLAQSSACSHPLPGAVWWTRREHVTELELHADGGQRAAARQYADQFIRLDAAAGPDLETYARRRPNIPPSASGSRSAAADNRRPATLWRPSLFVSVMPGAEAVAVLGAGGADGLVREARSRRATLEAWARDVGLGRLRPRLLMLVVGLEAAVGARHQQQTQTRRARGSPGSGAAFPAPDARIVTRDMVEDAVAGMAVELGVELVQTRGDLDAAKWILRASEAAAGAPYCPPTTRLSCSRKLRTLAAASAPTGDGSEDQPGRKRRRPSPRDTWCRQLQAIAGVSADKARRIVEQFPSFASLMDFYEGIDEGAEVRADDSCDGGRTAELGKGGMADYLAGRMGGRTLQRKLSRRIFAFFTSDNPDALV